MSSFYTCSRRWTSSSLTLFKSSRSERSIRFCSSSYFLYIEKRRMLRIKLYKVKEMLENEGTFMSNSCSIFQFSTHFILSRRAFLISEAECEGSMGATGVVAARRGAGGAVIEAEGKLGGSEAGTGGGGESALIWLSSSSSSRSVSSAVAVDVAL